jgi:hypothetical protein
MFRMSRILRRGFCQIQKANENKEINVAAELFHDKIIS